MEREKLKFLDGIRGIMALAVVIHHFVIVYYPQMYMPEFAAEIGGPSSIVATTPLNVFFNGNVAVQFFFILTGFLVCRSCLRDMSMSWKAVVTKSCNRYVRLLPVVAAATLFTFLSMILGLQRHLRITEMVAYGEYIGSFCTHQPSVTNLLYNMLLKPFVFGGGSDYIGPFWTIKYELWGYILCILLCKLFQKSRLRRMLYAFLALFLHLHVDASYTSMVMGVFIADLYYQREENTTFLSRLYSPWIYSSLTTAVLSVVGIYFVTCPVYFLGIHSWFSAVWIFSPSLIRAAGMTIIVFCLLCWRPAAKIFENRCLLFLGDLSFHIYAFHWPTMLVVEAGLFEYFYDKMSYDFAAILAFLLVLPVIFFVSYGSKLILERKTVASTVKSKN